MANNFTVTNYNSAANFAPTGRVNIVSGITNPAKVNAQANQQILVGDPLIQNSSSNTFTGLPVQCASVVGDTSNNASNNALQLAICQNFVGFATTYRSPKNTSSGKPSDVVSVATGRVKVLVNQNNATTYGNNTAVGSFWGVACTQNNQFNGTSSPLGNNSWVLQGPDGQPVYEQVTTNNHAIGKQALPRLASDPYVWLDVVSTLLGVSVQAPPS